MKRKSLATISTFKQKSSIPGKGTDDLLRRFLVIRRVSLLVLLITIALLLAFILANFFSGWLHEFELRFLSIAILLIFIIARLAYRQLKDTNVSLYVITLASILPVVGAIYLENTYHHYEGWDVLVTFLEILIAAVVFTLALFLTGWGHLCYQVTMMTKYRRQISISMLASTAVAAIIVIPLTIMVVTAMMRAARGNEDFLSGLLDVIFNVIDVIRLRDIIDFINFLA